MPKKESTLVNAILIAAYAAGGLLEMFMVSPYRRGRRLLYGNNYGSYRNSVYNLKNSGSIKVVEKNGKKFIKLTRKGELEVLLAKAKMPVVGKWDGKWRIIIFDIPESSKPQRNFLRRLLKKNNFRKLQASVYISPHPLNREAISYLYKTGLNDYIRIIRVDEMDNDKDLKKKFKL